MRRRPLVVELFHSRQVQLRISRHRFRSDRNCLFNDHSDRNAVLFTEGGPQRPDIDVLTRRDPDHHAVCQNSATIWLSSICSPPWL